MNRRQRQETKQIIELRLSHTPEKVTLSDVTILGLINECEHWESRAWELKYALSRYRQAVRDETLAYQTQGVLSGSEPN
jgi:hypothetical protein